MSVFFALFLTVSKLYLSSHRCHVCSKCDEPFVIKKGEIQSGCSFCSTVRTYSQDRLMVTSRSCVPVCVESDSRRSGTGIVTSCCSGDLCNSSGRIQISLPLIMVSIFAILPILSIKF
uniref:Snake toxin/toxin-like domain-containing protein n=1 Tax=Trichobilharzia regenti TaxID=157069 RepID=A0AA85JV02_TRIRE|nr:unnamed protein product [Trichobilharzia regenti]